jgi:PPP family 3-phenylpropionic acid transporter
VGLGGGRRGLHVPGLHPRFGKVSAPALLVAAGLAAIVRWIAYPLIWPLGFGVAGFFAVQTLHAVSTGLILLGVQKLIAETVAEERTGAAQGIAFFANGFSMAAATLLSGPLYAAFGVGGFFVMAVFALAGIGLIVLAARSAPERRLGR